MEFDYLKLKMDLASLAENTWVHAGVQIINPETLKILADELFGPKHRPGLMGFAEKLLLNRLAKSLEPKSKVVEVGTFLGAGASVLYFANPTLDIYTIDRYVTDWEYGPRQEEMVNEALSGLPRTQENIANWLKDCSTVTVLSGQSPEDFVDTTLNEISLLIEDSDHTNPGLRKNIEFWEPKLKPGGWYLFHDYRPWLPVYYDHKIRWQAPRRFFDVESEVQLMIEKGYEFIGTVGSFAILKKPIYFDNTQI